MNDIKEMWVDMFPNWEFKEVFKLRKPDIDKNICEEISYHGTCLTYGELVDTINGIYSEARNVQKENEELKKENQSWLKTASHLNTIAYEDRDYAKRMHKENEQLKQFKQNVFGLIDKKLEKDKHEYEMTYEDYLNGRIEVLEELKKELEE